MKKSPIIGFYSYWANLTYLGVISAVIGMNFAISGNIRAAMVCLMVCGLCDMFDGSVARTAKRTDREKSYGIQIDALADIVSFGVFPAVIGYAIFITNATQNPGQLETVINVAILAVYILAALIRLAYFNVIEMELQGKNEKRKYYEGLPVTMVALIIPIVYAICVHFHFSLSSVYNKMLFIISAAFILKIKIPKPSFRYLIGMLIAGVPIVIYILLVRRG